LKVLSNTLQHLLFPFRILIASRPEAHISRTISELKSKTSLREIDLSDDTLEMQANSDIRTFLVAKFNKIKETHPLQGLHIPHGWPTDENIDELVRRSSGQFIYASVVIRYISSARHQPVHRLRVILGLSPRPVKDFPFAQLDELYTYILGSVDDIETMLRILGILVAPKIQDHFGDYSTPDALGMLLGLRPGGTELLLIDLHSILTIDSPTKPVRILHASLGDFLLDQSRANEFYINIRLSHATLARGYMKVVPTMHGKYYHLFYNDDSCSTR
jgi:hypothetical protein